MDKHPKKPIIQTTGIYRMTPEMEVIFGFMRRNGLESGPSIMGSPFPELSDTFQKGANRLICRINE